MNKNKINMMFLLVLSAVFFVASCDFAKGRKVLARVDNEIITQQEFQTKINRLHPYYRALANEQKDKFLDDVINEKLFFKEASKRRIGNDKEVKELIEEARKKIIIAKLLEEEINKTVKVSDEEIEDFYNLHKKEFIASARYKAGHILVSTEREAKEVLDKLKKGGEFAALAKEFSIDATKNNGGDLGYFTEGQMIPDFESACFNLDIGQTSGIVKTQFGYHIINLTDKKPPQAKSLREVSRQIERRISEAKKISKMEDFLKQLRSKARISVDRKLLETSQLTDSAKDSVADYGQVKK